MADVWMAPTTITSYARHIIARDCPALAATTAVQRYLTLTRHAYSAAMIAMSATKFDQLPKNDQDRFIAAAAEVAPTERKLGRDEEARGIGELKQKGMQVLESVDSAAWQTALQPLLKTYRPYGDRLSSILND